LHKKYKKYIQILRNLRKSGLQNPEMCYNHIEKILTKIVRENCVICRGLLEYNERTFGVGTEGVQSWSSTLLKAELRFRARF